MNRTDRQRITSQTILYMNFLLLLTGGSLVSEGAQSEIQNVTRSAVRLPGPHQQTPERTSRYSVGVIFQVAPRLAAISCSLRVQNIVAVDFEDGSDLILFDDLGHLKTGSAITLSRSHLIQHPETSEPGMVLKFPIIGGFVPLGAKRPDGSEHPHAGTGFGINQSISLALDSNGAPNWKSQWSHEVEVRQFTYDGRHFRVVKLQTMTEAHPLRAGQSGWMITAPGLTTAIPDGDDLLEPVWAVRDGKRAAGISRWRWTQAGWSPVAFNPVTPLGLSWFEPSLIRDVDGSFLFCARRSHDITIWRSTDGREWAVAVSVPKVREESPVCLNQTASGVPYVAANPLGHGRERLSLWPLNPKRSGLEPPLVVRDAREEFGESVKGVYWCVDHPIGTTVQLADGQWHHLLVYRVMAKTPRRGPEPLPQTGCYIEEVTAAGPVIPTWKFE